MNIRQIEMFYATMTHGSITAAARMLNITQPAATRLLKHTEEQWGGELFARIKNRLIPTALAYKLFPEVEQAYKKIQDIRIQLSQVRDANRYHMRMGTGFSFASSLIPGLLDYLNEFFPSITLEIFPMRSHILIDSLVHNTLELGISYTPVNHSLLDCIHLTNNALYLVYPISYDISPDAPMQELLAYLSQKPYIQTTGNIATAAQLWLQSFIDIVPKITIHDVGPAYMLTQLGKGWSIFDYVVVYGANPPPSNLKIVPLPTNIALPMYLIKHSHQEHSRMVQCMNGIQQWIQNTLPGVSE